MRITLALIALALSGGVASAQCGSSGCPTASSPPPMRGPVRAFFQPPRAMVGGPGFYSYKATATASVSVNAGAAKRQPVRNLVGRVFGFVRCR